ncbi:MAG TPA: ABC transporter permease [Pyrinomonadaceae bacterium]|nr:ABC transporter permease [Pyrinomonadaceae bacterium]
MIQDLRYGIRMLLKHPWFTCTVVLTLALGIGANTALFSIINALLLRPLPLPQPEQVVQVWEVSRQSGNLKFPVALPNMVDWRTQSSSFAHIAAYSSAGVNLTVDDQPEHISLLSVTIDYFRVIGVAPAMGRDLREEDGLPDAPRTAVLSHGFWQRRFASDPQIVGRTIRLNSENCTIIGVMPKGFAFPNSEVAIWAPMRGNLAAAGRHVHSYQAIARLKPGVGLQQAQTEMDAIASRLEQEYAGTNKDVGVRLVSLQKELVESDQPRLLLLFGALFTVLLITCANLAGLLSARASARQKESAIRSALGAGRHRLVRQMLTESMLMVLLGGALGVLVAYLGVKALLAIYPTTPPTWTEFGIDRAALIFTLGISVLVGLGFGLLPALQFSRTRLNETLKEGNRGTAGRATEKLRAVLVTVQIALALVLLTAGGLLIRSMWQLQQVNPGFNPEQMLTMQLTLPRAKYAEDEQRSRFFEGVLEQIKALPDVKSAAVASQLPFVGGNSASSFQIVGGPPLPKGETLDTNRRTVSTDYFQTLGLQLLRGRTFDSRDTAKGPRAVVINEAMARKFWPGDDPLGRYLTFNSDTQYEIIGVVSNAKHSSLQEEDAPQAYTSHQQVASRTMDLAVRANYSFDGEPAPLINAIRQTVTKIDPEQAVHNIGTMEQRLSESIAPQRFVALLLSLFAALALIQALIGIYGVMSYAVAQRKQELGIRIALGAQPGGILSLVLRRGMKLTLIGLGLGLIGAVASTRLLRDMLFGIKPFDPLTFAGMTLLLVCISLLACFLPARRATKVDPMNVLRND